MKLTRELIDNTFLAGNMTLEQRELLLKTLEEQEEQERKEIAARFSLKNPMWKVLTRMHDKKVQKDKEKASEMHKPAPEGVQNEKLYRMHERADKAIDKAVVSGLTGVDTAVGVGCKVVDVAANVAKVGVYATGIVAKQGVKLTGVAAHKVNDGIYATGNIVLGSKQEKDIVSKADELAEQYL